MESSQTPHRKDEVVHRDLADGDSVLLHVGSGNYHGLNGVGSAVWRLIDGKRTVAELIATLRTQVDNPPDSLAADVTGFLDDLHARALIGFC
jgi:hypothetical protein